MGWIWTAVGIYLLVLVLMFTFQRSMLYLASHHQPALAAAGLRAVTLESSGGAPSIAPSAFRYESAEDAS